jgi:hypothetical protein
LNTIHLTEEELTAAAMGERDARSARHLEICADCWQQMANYREGLVELRQDVSLSAGRSALEWGRQSRSILERIAEKQGPAAHSPQAVWVLAIAAVALLAMLSIPFAYRPSQTLGGPAQTVEISDAVLLQGVEARVGEQVPDALQPAGLLLDEMGGIQAPSKTSHSHSPTRNAQ